MPDRERILLIGYGSIARALARQLDRDQVAAVLLRPGSRSRSAAEADGLAVVESLAQALSATAPLAVECAGHEAVAAHAPGLLRAGRRLVLASVGALVDDRLREALAVAARDGGTQAVLTPGAVAGVDALAAARPGLEQVTYVGRKPPRAWAGTPAEAAVDLDSVAAPTTVFEGTAREAARLFPKNANVAATVALAGLGLDATAARLVADPTVTRNVHEIAAEGAFGELKVRIANNPSPDNPKTSALVALSLARILRNEASPIVL